MNCCLLELIVSGELTRVIDLGTKPPVTVNISGRKRAVVLNYPENWDKLILLESSATCATFFGLTIVFEDFYDLMNTEPGFSWIPEQGAGRMLRSPTVFEDLVKMICTTNCSWSLTEKMVTGLVENLGRQEKDGRRTFPSPQAMALMPLKFLTTKCGRLSGSLSQRVSRPRSFGRIRR